MKNVMGFLFLVMSVLVFQAHANMVGVYVVSKQDRSIVSCGCGMNRKEALWQCASNVADSNITHDLIALASKYSRDRHCSCCQRSIIRTDKYLVCIDESEYVEKFGYMVVLLAFMDPSRHQIMAFGAGINKEDAFHEAKSKLLSICSNLGEKLDDKYVTTFIEKIF